MEQLRRLTKRHCAKLARAADCRRSYIENNQEDVLTTTAHEMADNSSAMTRAAFRPATSYLRINQLTRTDRDYGYGVNRMKIPLVW